MTSTPNQNPNRLGDETSPYLLQHAANPVDWYAWGEEAFAAARASGKPVLLSIGYSACHWCHVMAHESFENPATAAVMNELFVNIKVDREERPDVDRIYQLAHQLLTRRAGGWPLTMFLSHDDQRPFFGGTYFPPSNRHGLPAFSDLLQRVSQVYREHGAELRNQSAALVEALESIDAATEPLQGELTDAPLQLLRVQLEQRFDRPNGGFSPAPKFPHAGMIDRLLRHWHATAGTDTPDLQALFMATLTLKRMAEGGLFDQLGGGFCRYSVDERWEIPHFEKMLYDNGSLLSVYSTAASATGDPLFARIADETAEFLLRDLRDAQGAFHASWDADSEGHEGQFYLWTPEQVRTSIDAGSATSFIHHYGLDRPANFEGRWHLVASAEPDDRTLLDAARTALLQIRSHRVPPGRDDKILTSWNALAIKGLSDAAGALDQPRFADAAAEALEFLRREHWPTGRLLATSRHGDARLDAYLDDHAYLIDAILTLLTQRFDAGWLTFAARLADALLERFEDPEHGGFFFTAHDHESLIHRSRNFHDDATPSGNAIAAAALLKLGWLLTEPRYLEAAERTLRAAWRSLAQPLGQVWMAGALELYLDPPRIVILRGHDEEIDLWRRELQRVWRPDVLVLAIPGDAVDLPPALASKTTAPDGSALAYVCRGSTCSPALASLPELLQTLRPPAAAIGAPD